MALIPQHNTLGLGRIEKCDRQRRGQPFCQLVEPTDITMLQLPNVCPTTTSSTLNSGGDFTLPTNIDNFTQYNSGGKLSWEYDSETGGRIKVAGESTAIYPTAYEYTTGDIARLDISVILCPGATATVIFFDGGTLDGDSESVIVQVLSATGTYTIYHTNTYAAGKFAVYITGMCVDANNYIDYFRLKSQSPTFDCYDINLRNSAGVLMGNATLYGSTSEYAHYFIDWSQNDIPDDCYTVCIEGGDDLFVNNIFTHGDNGTFEANASGITSTLAVYGVSSDRFYNGIKSFKAVYNTGGTSVLITTGAIGLKNLTNYRISAKVYIDVTPYQVQDAFIAIQPNGSYSDIGTAAIAEPTEGGEWITIYYDFTPLTYGFENEYTFTIYASGSDWNSSDTTIYIDEIKLYELDNQPELCSPCFILKRSHGCTLKLEWWNDNDAYGYYYDGTGFKHSIRVAGSLARINYSGEKETFKDTEGVRRVVYADKEKHYELAIRDMPEYMHDALAIGIDHDNFTIDGEYYIIEEGGYEPQWRKTSDLAPVILDVKPKTQNLTNSYC